MRLGQCSVLSGEFCVAFYTHQPDYRLPNSLSYPTTHYQTNCFTRPHHLIFAFYIVILIFDFLFLIFSAYKPSYSHSSNKYYQTLNFGAVINNCTFQKNFGKYEFFVNSVVDFYDKYL
jgi:hypothetical protein